MTQKPSILLVDDDQLVLETFQMWLEDEGYQVFAALSKDEAVKILKKNAIAVCMVDLKMKEENGLKVSLELKKMDELLKVIIITGFPTYESAIDAMKMGIYDYVSKASENHEILAKIESALGARRNEISSKGRQTPDQESMILVCHHMMIKEGFENFCRENADYQLTHTYHSVDYIKSSDFNNSASLVLLCSNCNHADTTEPEKMLSRLNIFFPNAKMVFINCQLDDERKINLVKLGVKGFLPKNISKDKMQKAFKTIKDGQMWISRQLSQTLLKELMEKNSTTTYKKPKNTYNLSNREIEIIEVIASGLSNLEISEKLYISEKTVKAHINHIFKKMKVKSRTQAVKMAAEAHII